MKTINFLTFCLFLVLPFGTLAQTIKGSFALGGDANFGNFNSVGLTLRSELKKDTGDYTWAISPNYRWSKQSKPGESEYIKYEDELYLTSSLTKRWGNWKILGFNENERSYLRKIDLRISGGFGLGHSIIKNKNWDVNLSEVILPEYYWSGVNTEWNNFTVRASSRFKAEFNSKSFNFSSITLFQPAIFSSREVSFSDNLNLRSSNQVSYKIASGREIGLVYIGTYQGYPYYISKSIKPGQQNVSLFFKANF